MHSRNCMPCMPAEIDEDSDFDYDEAEWEVRTRASPPFGVYQGPLKYQRGQDLYASRTIIRHTHMATVATLRPHVVHRSDSLTVLPRDQLPCVCAAGSVIHFLSFL